MMHANPAIRPRAAPEIFPDKDTNAAVPKLCYSG
jgi:hypothetical protein